MEDGTQLVEAATLMKVLSDRNRLRVFALLMEGDSCNCELRDKLNLPSNLLSHHLRILHEAGLVQSRRDIIDARWVYYSVDRKFLARWHAWFETFLDPSRVRRRDVLCGPEGQSSTIPLAEVSTGN